MWIRSQDKKTLMECTKIELDTKNFIVGFNGCYKDLGVYSTEEKALKVLDKITETINMGYADIVYQMPQDSEVE